METVREREGESHSHGQDERRHARTITARICLEGSLTRRLQQHSLVGTGPS
jgi:hypothetical protein